MGVTVAFKVAVVWATDDAGLGSTVGGFGSVVNVSSTLATVLPELVATTRKWYIVSAFRPATDADTSTEVLPDAEVGVHDTDVP